MQLFHSKSGASYAKTPHFRAAFSVLHLSSTHFGAGYKARTRFPASHELPAAICRNPASPLIGCALRARVEAASSLRLTKKQDTQIGCPVLTVQQRRKTAEVLRNGRKRVCGKPISGFLHHFNPKRNTTLLGGVSFCLVLTEKMRSGKCTTVQSVESSIPQLTI